MKSVRPLVQLAQASRDDLLEQMRLRRDLVDAVLAALHGAPTLPVALTALQGYAETFLALGLHDEAARLAAFGRIVAGDIARLEREAEQLEARAAGPAPVDPPQLAP